MLLHGVPGVGKTSTAGKCTRLNLVILTDGSLTECVADSFRRPLFQITSGNICPELCVSQANSQQAT